MPTLRECCVMLQIGRTTLEKWMKRLEITPTRHAWDLRFYVLSDEQLERIREARSQMPAVSSHRTSRGLLYAPHDAPTGQPGGLAARHPRSMSPGGEPSENALVRPSSVLAAASSLPDGLISVYDMARQYNVSISSVEKVYARGVLPCTIGRWKVGTAIIKYALDAEQQAAFLERWPT